MPMINSLIVKNFRLFRQLEVRRLNRVNLVVGRNSAGKSAFLESLQLYAANGSPAVLLELVSNRDGYWESEILDSEEAPSRLEHPFRSLFYGYHLPEPGQFGIEVGPLEGPRITIQTELYRTIEEGETIRRVPVPHGVDDAGLDAELNLQVRDNEKVIFVTPAAIDVYELNRFRRRPPPFLGGREERQTYQYVPAQSGTESKLPSYWDKVHLTDLEAEVIGALKIIQPDITGVAFVGEGSDRPSYGRPRQRRVPIVKLATSSERIPLKGLGDGISRLLELVLALVNAKHGFLFIDEIENGLHWTVMPQLWRVMFRLAHSLDVQLFASTHSRDCIEGYKAIWKQFPDSGTFHRLDPDKEFGARAKEYNLLTLSDAIEAEVEVR